MSKRYWMNGAGHVWLEESKPDDSWREVLPVVVGSREWGCVMAMRGEKVSCYGWPNNDPWPADDIAEVDPDTPTSGWYLLPTGPKRGDRVRWWRGEDSGTGTLDGWLQDNGRDICVTVAGSTLYVERVEPL